MGEAAMRFLCDAMLGRLSRWLRLLGYDTAYSDADDHELARQARAEDRILLTRDTDLANRRGIRASLVTSDDPDEQLRQIIEEFNLTQSRILSRCPTCNTRLHRIPKQAVREHVPPYVFHRHTTFQECPGCGKVYWRGSHWERIQDRLEALNTGEPEDGG